MLNLEGETFITLPHSWGDLPVGHIALVAITDDAKMVSTHLFKSLQFIRPVVQIPQCIIQILHNAPFSDKNVHLCAHFCYKIVHRGIFV